MNEAVGEYSGFETLEDLQGRNLELLRAWKTQRGSLAIDGVKAFLAMAIATGKRLMTAQERELAQASVDFWTTELISRESRSAQDAARVLAPFDEAALPKLDEDSPFKGLRPYEEQDASFYHGREGAVAALAAQVLGRAVTIVKGPSGSGKSSLINAGLLPLLRKRNFAVVRIASPGGDPLAELTEAVLGEGADHDRSRNMRDQLEADPASFGKTLRDKSDNPILLIVDQFEETLTLNASVKARDIFARAIAVLPPDCRTVIGVRDDFLEQVRKLPGLEPIVAVPENVFSVPPIPPADLKRSIAKAADRAGLRFADGVVDNLVRSIAGEPAGLPLLQFTLEQMWKEAKRTRTNWISQSVAAQVGSPRDALKRAAEKVYDNLALDQNKDSAREIFLALVTPGLESEFVRQPRRRATLHEGRNPDQVDRVLRDFTDAGLLRLEKGRTDADDWFDVTHEALIRNWPRLYDWLATSRETNRKFLQFREAAKLWDGHGRVSYLAGAALREASFFKGRSDTLDALIAHSERAEAEAERAEVEAESARIASDNLREKNKRRLIWVAAIVAIVMAALLYSQKQAEIRTQQVLGQLVAERLAAENEALQTEAANSRTNIKQEVRRSLDGFGRGDIGPLQEFLRRYGNAQDSELDLLSLRRLAAGRDDSRAQVVANSPKIDLRQVASLGTCSGYLWLGSAEAPKVSPFPAAETAKGTALTMQTSVRLREKPPPNPTDYTFYKQIGVIPDDAKITLGGEIKDFPRPLGLQRWAQIDAPRQYCTSVFIQYFGSDPSRLADVQKALGVAGYQVPPPETIETARGRAEVRYFYEGDKRLAANVASRLASFNANRSLAETPLLQFPAKPTAGTIEVWIDLSK